MKQLKIKINLMLLMSLMAVPAHAEWPWYVKAGAIGAVAQGFCECVGWGVRSGCPREPLAHRVWRRLSSPVKLILMAASIEVKRNERTKDQKIASGKIYQSELCKQVAMPIIYESVVELAHKTGIEACFKKAYAKLTAYVGRPAPWAERMACTAASVVAYTAISKTLDSFDPTMPRAQRATFGFSPLVNFTARFGYDN